MLDAKPHAMSNLGSSLRGEESAALIDLRDAFASSGRDHDAQLICNDGRDFWQGQRTVEELNVLSSNSAKVAGVTEWQTLRT
jgi:hypothetical protein